MLLTEGLRVDLPPDRRADPRSARPGAVSLGSEHRGTQLDDRVPVTVVLTGPHCRFTGSPRTLPTMVKSVRSTAAVKASDPVNVPVTARDPPTVTPPADCESVPEPLKLPVASSSANGNDEFAVKAPNRTCRATKSWPGLGTLVVSPATETDGTNPDPEPVQVAEMGGVKSHIPANGA